MPVSRHGPRHDYYTATATHAASPEYYYEDTEGYVGDYSESEDVSSDVTNHLPNNDVTEIYHRRNLMEVDRYGECCDPQYYYDIRTVRKNAAAEMSHCCRNKSTGQALVEIVGDVVEEERGAVGEEQPRIPLEHLHPHRRYHHYHPHHQRRLIQPVSATYQELDFYEKYEPVPYRMTTCTSAPSQRRVSSRHGIKQSMAHQATGNFNSKHSVHHPVTVRTPRYYRRSGVNTTLSKRPSTLCLPLASKPDPAVHRKCRRSPETGPPVSSTMVTVAPVPDKTHRISRRLSVVSASRSPKHQIAARDGNQYVKDNSQTEVNIKESNLDNILNRYEQEMVNKKQNYYRTDDDSDMSKTKAFKKSERKSRTSMAAHRQEKILRQEANKNMEKCRKCSGYESSSPTSPTLQQRENVKSNECISNGAKMGEGNPTSDMLDSLLADLMKNGCNNKIPIVENKTVKTDTSVSKNSIECKTTGNNITSASKQKHTVPPKSVNYQQIAKLSEQKLSDNEYSDRNPRSPPRPSTSHLESRIGPNNNNNKIKGATNSTSMYISTTNAKTPPVAADDREAQMELHKSKSYIVNLIDRALSRELGTLPEETINTTTNTRMNRAYGDLSPRAAIDMVKTVTSNASRIDKDLNVEITQALTESLISNATAPQPDKPDHPESDRCSNIPSEEPAFVKQLKQLRWGHLRHIQREVRRLEDLERFLDSCSSGSSFMNTQTNTEG